MANIRSDADWKVLTAALISGEIVNFESAKGLVKNINNAITQIEKNGGVVSRQYKTNHIGRGRPAVVSIQLTVAPIGYTLQPKGTDNVVVVNFKPHRDAKGRFVKGNPYNLPRANNGKFFKVA